ncbi:SERTA domain-containing protein 3 [Marasmius crinis-equi]|uniref:SERTA domain-containing protein 3 n=1 Tax=Marasmius crinis-equi TaxID=585013 RepID=A0ABR3EWW9_9AGAR
MPNRPTFTGQRAEFLAKKGPEYAKARENGTHKDVVAMVQHQFLLRWPIGSENVDLTEDELESFDNDAPLPERPDPKERRSDFKSDEEFKEAERSWKQYNKDVTTRKRQIEDRLKSDYSKEHAPAMKKGDKHPFTPLLNQLSYGKKEAQKGKPRKQSAEQAWADANKSYLDAVHDKQKQEEASKHPDLPAPAVYNKVLREEFAKLSEEEQKEWQERSQTEHATGVKDWKEKQNAKPSEKPEDRQACINRLNEFCMPILEGIAERTGWCCSLLLGGPEPRDGGRLNMIALHAGKPTSGPVKMQFGRSELHAWREGFFPVFSRHLKKVFTMEECRARALPSDYTLDGEVQADGEEVLRWREPENEGQGQGGKANGKETEGQSKEGDMENEKDEKSKKVGQSKGSSQSSKKLGAGTGKAKGGGSKSKRQDGKSGEATAEESMDDDEDEDEDDIDKITVTRSSPPRTRGSNRQSASSAASVTPSSPLREIEPCRTPVSPVNRSQSPFIAPAVSPSPDWARISPMPPSSANHSPICQSGTPDPNRTSRTPSPVPSLSERREATPSPAPNRSPSPLPEAGRPSIQRKTDEIQPPPLASKRRQTGGTHSSEPASGQKRKNNVPSDSEAASKKRRVEKPVEEPSANDITQEPFPELPEGVSGDAKFYARQALALFQREEAKKLSGWTSMVRDWLEHERQGEFDAKKSRGKLSTQGRPKWVGDWVQRARNPEYRPDDKASNNVTKLLTDWWAWWASLQPKWRAFSGEKRPLASNEYTEGSWDSIRAIGPNGLTSVIAPLVHAASVLEGSPSTGTGRDRKTREGLEVDLQRAVDDVAHVLGRLLATSNT